MLTNIIQVLVKKLIIKLSFILNLIKYICINKQKADIMIGLQKNQGYLL